MSSDTRPAPAAGNRSKRRVIEADDDARQNPEDSPANPKRQRVSRACDSCRSKKDKCDGVQPVCSTCASLSRPCTYKANPKKRGLPTGYIRTIELLWGLVFCKIQGSEDVVRALMKQANMPSHLATMGKEAEGSDTLLSSWKNSFLLKDIEKMLLFLEQPEDERAAENESPPDAEGSSVLSADALEWHMPESGADGREHSTASGFSPVKTPSATSNTRYTLPRPVRDSAIQTTPDDFTQQPQPPSIAAPGRTVNTNLKLPPNTWPLLDIYFSYTQCWFPILEKHDILRTAFRLSEEDTVVPPLSAESGDYASLWAILTLASFQEASITTTRQLSRPPTEQSDPNQLYTTTVNLVPTDGIYSVGHVQALLILSLVKIGQQDWPAAWRLVGRAVRIFQCLELDISSNAASKGREYGAGRTKHVLLGCFVLETLVALRTGNPPSLRKECLSRAGPIDEDGLEEWHPWEDQTGFRPVEQGRAPFHRGPLHALSTFNRLVSLMCILNDFCCLTFDSITPTQLESLQRQLQLWVTALPRSYRVDLQGGKPASPHIFALEVMHEGASVVLNREFAVMSEGDGGTIHKNRLTESSKRLTMLLQKYMDTYSLSATCPTFGAIATLGIQKKENSPQLEPGLKQKLQSFSSHLNTVWRHENQIVDLNTQGQLQHAAAPAIPRHALPLHDTASSSSVPPPMPTGDGSMRRATTVDDNRSGFSAPESFLSNSWMRTAPSIDDSALSVATPTPSISMNRTADPSRTPHRHRSSMSSKPMNPPHMIPDLTPTFPPAAPQYQTPYNDPSLNLGSFVDIDGYGPLHRPRIAPDLDALFDELASLDGTEKADNQPEFMQNLGFVPDAGIPELYSYASQVEPFLLAQTQQLPQETGGVPQEGNNQSTRQ
ncbi:fungal-specific transcription factor domain-containing protein [Aspergillus ambiguus]|uniref:putative C6 transcription factor QutA n=1 Tax=Aspergillus ambiguus TaxID=176160 RepID=UPI003CCD3D1B